MNVLRTSYQAPCLSAYFLMLLGTLGASSSARADAAPQVSREYEGATSVVSGASEPAWTTSSSPASADTPAPQPTTAAIARQSEVNLLAPSKKARLTRSGSPQRFAFEIKLGPYLPDVDRGVKGLGPYAQTFGRLDATGHAIGQPKAAIMPAFAFEWQFLYAAGPLGLGIQVGFMRDQAKAIIAEPVQEGQSIRSAADTTTFNLVPVALQLVYRFELLADRYRVPLVPYAKGGLAYGFWWSKNGNGDISVNSKGQKASGGSVGWQVNAGGMFRLDALEPRAAKKMDQVSGINHAYIFGEYQVARIDGFGQKGRMSLGDNTWFAGLGIEF